MAATLLDAPLGAHVTLDTPEVQDGLRLRLAEMGLRCGQCVCPLQRTPGGGRIVGVGTARVALDRGTCRLLRLLQENTGPSAQDTHVAARRLANTPQPVPDSAAAGRRDTQGMTLHSR